MIERWKYRNRRKYHTKREEKVVNRGIISWWKSLAVARALSWGSIRDWKRSSRAWPLHCNLAINPSVSLMVLLDRLGLLAFQYGTRLYNG